MRRGLSNKTIQIGSLCFLLLSVCWITSPVFGIGSALSASPFLSNLPQSGLRKGKLARQMQTDYFQLDAAAELIGSFGVQAHDIIRQAAGHLGQDCHAVLKETQSFDSVSTIHEYYLLDCSGLKVSGAYISLHLQDHRLAMASWQLPEGNIPTADELISRPLPILQTPFDYTLYNHQPVLFDDGGNQLIPAFDVMVASHDDDGIYQLTVDADSGAILTEELLSFQMTTVYQQNPKHGGLVTTALANLTPSGFLDGKNFSVYNPGNNDPRLQSVGAQFSVHPATSTPSDFDQVQVYYGATQALSWFREKFGFDTTGVQIDIRINDYPGGRPDNAEYKPTPDRPQILIGAGNANISGLARDNDVITHEFAHHVIYQRLKSAKGESGVLHEGFADFFTYAMYENPYLAESTIPGRDYLRTALIDPQQRIDDPELPLTSHFRGQIWSALLWQLRQEVGPGFDQVVYRSLFFLDANSGYRDALYALLNADDATNSGLTEDNSEPSSNYCRILEKSVERGFATFIEDVDGEPCRLDLIQAAATSREFAAGKSTGGGPRIEFEMFGRKCGVITEAANNRSLLGLIILLALPLVLVATQTLVRRMLCI